MRFRERSQRSGQDRNTLPTRVQGKKPSGWFTYRTKDGRSRRLARDLGVSPETFRKKRVNQAEIDVGDRGGLPPKSKKNCAAFVEK